MLSLLFCLNRKCALGESVRSEQSSGAGEFAVFGVALVGVRVAKALCVAEWGVGV